MSEQKLCARCGGVIVPIDWETILENARADNADEMAFLRDRVSTLTKEHEDALLELQVLRKAIGIASLSEEDHALF